ncbi:MAG: 16S rRNA (guanine(966)-N(2))-methyltransferase RsmD [Phycisphaerales bacterium]
MLRVIAGDLKRRTIRTPPDGSTTRPLPDRVRTALFNMLAGHLEGCDVLDCFAGTGSFGIEALSRGAEHAVFVERDKKVADLIEANLRELGVWERATLVRADALSPTALAMCPRPVHVVFMDPPYPLMQDPTSRGRIMDRLAEYADLLDDDGFAIIRTPWPYEDRDDEGTRTDVPLEHPGLEGPETHVYGSTAVHWYMKA